MKRERIQTQSSVADHGVTMAGTFIVTVPLSIIALVMGRQLVHGIMKGAVKG